MKQTLRKLLFVVMALFTLCASAQISVGELAGKTVRRTVAHGEKLYVLALDAEKNPTILVYDAATNAVVNVSTEGMIASKNTHGLDEDLLICSDIQVTDDGYLIASNKTENNDVDGVIARSMTVYKWANDDKGFPTGAPVAWLEANTCAMWVNAYVGGSIAYVGDTNNGTLYVSSERCADDSKGTRIRFAKVKVENGVGANAANIVSIKANYNGSALTVKDLGADYRICASPINEDHIIVTGSGSQLTMAEYTFADASFAGVVIDQTHDIAAGVIPSDINNICSFKYGGAPFAVVPNDYDGMNFGATVLDISEGLEKAFAFQVLELEAATAVGNVAAITLNDTPTIAMVRGEKIDLAPVLFPMPTLPEYPDYVSLPSQGATVSNLSTFSVGWSNGQTATWMGMTDLSGVGVFNLDGEKVASLKEGAPVSNDPDNTKLLLFQLDKEITDAGTYTFRIPAGYFMQGFSMSKKNIDLEFTFIVEPSFVPTLDTLYLVGAPTGWVEPSEANADAYANWILTETEQGSKVYRGKFEIPAGQAQFRFYDELAGWDVSKQYGFAVENKEVDQVMTKNKFNGPMVEGQGQWYFTTWFGGSMDITVDLNKMVLDIVATRAEVNMPSLFVLEGENSVNLNEADFDEQGYYIYYATIDVPAGEFTIGDIDKTIVLGGGVAMTSGVQIDVTNGGKALTYTSSGAESVSVELLYNLNSARPSKLTLTDIFPIKFVSSNPENDAKLEEGISEIVLTFSEDVYTARAFREEYEGEDWTPIYYSNVTLTDQNGKSNDLNDENAPYVVDMYVDYTDTKNVKVTVTDNLGSVLPEGIYTLKVNAGCIEAMNGTTNEEVVVKFTIGNPGLGVEGIAVDASTAVYYNLQGVKVGADQLTPGIYVKVQGQKATKVEF